MALEQMSMPVVGGIGAGVVAGWGVIKGYLSRIYGLFVVRVNISGPLQEICCQRALGLYWDKKEKDGKSINQLREDGKTEVARVELLEIANDLSRSGDELLKASKETTRAVNDLCSKIE